MSESKAPKRTQPPWGEPIATQRPTLKVNNSLKSEVLVDFVPQSKTVRWYTCGPTVYDSSHLGHARTYLSFDIIKRIIENYFGYNIFYCMNITDIDDKIILKARQTYLFEEYAKNNPTITQVVLDDLAQAWEKNINSMTKKIADTVEALRTLVKGSKIELEALKANYTQKLLAGQDHLAGLNSLKIGDSAVTVIEEARSALPELLDGRHGKTMNPELVKKLCADLSTKYENEYFDDMKKLGVADPDVLVRVSEYVPLCVDMCTQIIQNGFAYASEGSVYFDTHKFHNTEPHVYGKLRPDAIGNLDLLQEGEGGLSTEGAKRKSDKDFALWKGSKDGEPCWDSPYGKGRPGWHIECSAMAGEILGPIIDVHCGGEDLKFPHHDNEMAQAEAFFDNKQWINYFFHTGHLEIDGLKMSKSLKNFITIREILEKFNANQIRMLFLLQSWDKKMNYQRVDTMFEADTKIVAFNEFFRKVDQIKLEVAHSKTPLNEAWNDKDKSLHTFLLESQAGVDEALCNNFDTAHVIQHLIDLVKKSNSYLTNNSDKKFLLLKKNSDFIKRILSVFGLTIGAEGASAAGGETREQVLFPYVQTLATFRKSVRSFAKKNEPSVSYLNLCDEVRDEDLPKLGVKIVDDSQNDFFFDSPEALEKEVRQGKIKKKQLLLNKKQKEYDNLMQASLTPAQHIQNKYKIVMVDNTVPEKDMNDKPIPKGLKGKLPKEWDTQSTSHSKYLTQIENTPHTAQDLKNEIADIEAEIQELSK